MSFLPGFSWKASIGVGEKFRRTLSHFSTLMVQMQFEIIITALTDSMISRMKWLSTISVLCGRRMFRIQSLPYPVAFHGSESMDDTLPNVANTKASTFDIKLHQSCESCERSVFDGMDLHVDTTCQFWSGHRGQREIRKTYRNKDDNLRASRLHPD